MQKAELPGKKILRAAGDLLLVPGYDWLADEVRESAHRVTDIILGSLFGNDPLSVRLQNAKTRLQTSVSRKQASPITQFSAKSSEFFYTALKETIITVPTAFLLASSGAILAATGYLGLYRANPEFATGIVDPRVVQGIVSNVMHYTKDLGGLLLISETFLISRASALLGARATKAID